MKKKDAVGMIAKKPGAVPLSVRISTLLQPKGPTVVTRAHGDQEIEIPT